MFNGHTMSVVTDLNLLGPAINDVNNIAIAAITTGDYPKLPNVYNASILIPPTGILMDWADGNMLALSNGYPNYLMSQDPDNMLVALIAALTKFNVVLYIPADDFAVYGMLLLQHLQFVYGITCNSLNTQYYFDRSKIPFIISKFYLLGVMDAQDYLDSYPANAVLPNWVVPKLVEDIPVPGLFDINKQIQYYNQLNASKAQKSDLKVMVNFVGGNQ